MDSLLDIIMIYVIIRNIQCGRVSLLNFVLPLIGRQAAPVANAKDNRETHEIIICDEHYCGVN
jgi:hypothetical protein